jgi:hypothetical protein
MSHENISKIDISISQDWSKLITIYKNVVNQWSNNKLHRRVYLENIDTYHYDLGNLGSLTDLDQITPGFIPENKTATASFLHGNIIENNLPWAKKLREDLTEINLSSICMFYTDKDIIRHTDKSNDIERPNDICKINFFINDSNGALYVEKNNKIESAPAKKNTAWLLDVAYPHWATVENELFLFQLCFYKPYYEVLQWFDNHPGLSY